MGIFFSRLSVFHQAKEEGMQSTFPFTLPNVAKVSPLVTRVMGLNPSEFTLTGSCTYLVGKGPQRTLIDTGGGIPEYAKLIEEALKNELQEEKGVSSVGIDKILLTHSHEDHVGGIKDVRSMFPEIPIFKLPSAYRPAADAAIPKLQMLKGGEVFEANGATLSVVPTPGHCDDHAVFLLKEENAFFTGDIVLGYGSTVFMCFTDFMASLQLMREMKPAKIYPGHGPVVEDGTAKLDEYISHRQKREMQVLETLRSYVEAAAANGAMESSDTLPSMTAMDIVKKVYVDTPEHLHFAAALNVSHHLRKLWHEKIVAPHSSASKDALELLSVSEYTMDKGKETTPERDRVMLLLDVPWTMYPGGKL